MKRFVFAGVVLAALIAVLAFASAASSSEFNPIGPRVLGPGGGSSSIQICLPVRNLFNGTSYVVCFP